MTIPSAPLRPLLPLGLALTLFVTAGCGAAGTRPDDMTAEQHRAHAAEAAAAAKKHDAKYDKDARAADPVAVSDSVTGGAIEWSITNYNPTDVHHSQAQEMKRAAAAHIAAAKTLETYEDGVCKKFPAQTRRLCPVHGPVLHWEPIPGGVRLQVRKGMPVSAVADHARCHVAFGRVHGRNAMPDCPLYVGQVNVTSDAKAGTIDLTTTDKSAVAELRRRAATHSVRKGSKAKGGMHTMQHHHKGH